MSRPRGSRARVPTIRVDSARRADLMMLGAGVVLFASPFVRWVRRGPGNSLSGREMIDAIVALGDTLPGMSAARLALAWYLVPASGAALWIAVGLDRGRRTVALSALVLTLLVWLAFWRLAGLGALGAGPWLALGGATTAAVFARSRPRNGSVTPLT